MANPETSGKKLSDLGLRLVSALVLGPLVLLITYLGGIAFVLLMCLTATLFLWEWFSITGAKHRSVPALIGFASLVGLSVLVYLGLAAAGLGLLMIAAFVVFAADGFSKDGRWAGEGVLYSGLSLFSLLVLREGTVGLLFAFFLLFVVWATDIFAYFTGRALGGPKLWQRVSPKKTWSGAIGGLVFACIFGVGVVYWAGESDLVLWCLLAALLSVVSQAGDLLESAIKRRFDVKDSSRLIPGHGGIMDRIDGLVAAAIFAVIAGWISGGALADPISGFGFG